MLGLPIRAYGLTAAPRPSALRPAIWVRMGSPMGGYRAKMRAVRAPLLAAVVVSGACTTLNVNNVSVVGDAGPSGSDDASSSTSGTDGAAGADALVVDATSNADARADDDAGGADADGATDSGSDDAAAAADVDAGGDADAGPPSIGYCVEHCDDPACQALVTCTEAAPPGWVGPVEVYRGAAPPTCAGPFPAQAISGGDSAQGGAATCSTCSCGTASTPFAACSSSPDLKVYLVGGSPALDCNAGAEVLWSGSCFQPNRHFRLRSEIPGSCTPSPQTPSVPPAEWTTKVVACQPPPLAAGTCAGGNVCSPRPEPTFGQKLCIATTSGDVPCPAGPYSDRSVVFTAFNDTRSCSACACGSTTIPCATGVALYTDTSCNTPNFASSDVTTCLAPNALGSAKLTSTGAPKTDLAAACAATQSTPSGGVTGGSPATICCLP